jgi:hypothetical protein
MICVYVRVRVQQAPTTTTTNNNTRHHNSTKRKKNAVSKPTRRGEKDAKEMASRRMHATGEWMGKQ